MTQVKTQREINQDILDSYDGSDIMNPQVILRQVHQVDGDVLDDDLRKVEVSMSDIPDEDLGEFSWAALGLLLFRSQYLNILEDPIERIHLEALLQSGCRIFIEDKCANSHGNGKSHKYGGMSTTINGKPAVVLVAGSLGGTTLLHEAIHNSDLRLDTNLYNRNDNFSGLKLHHAAIMMLDAQKIMSSAGYKSVEACRRINRVYKDGEMYVEGLTWVTQLPMETLAKEKNHIGKHLKVLHALYTEAILKKQSAILTSFRYWRPSEHVAAMLTEYDKNKQKIGKNRDKILRQQKHFWDELLRFRRGINKLKVRGLANKKLSCYVDVINFCKKNGVNSLVSAYLAQQKADELYQQAGQDRIAHVENLKSLFAEIKPNDLNHSSLFAEKFLPCYIYLRKVSKELLLQGYAESIFKFPFDGEEKNSVTIRKKFYDNLKARVNIFEKQVTTGCSNKQCTLAYLYGSTLPSIVVGEVYVTAKMNSMTAEQKCQFAAETIDYACQCASYSDSSKDVIGRFQAQAVVAMTNLIQEYNLPIDTHGLFQPKNLKDFEIPRKVVKDLYWLKTNEKADGLPQEMYSYFDAGLIDEYCQRPARAFNRESPDFIPNNYRNKGKGKTAYVRALYELLAARHRYQATTHCKTFPQELRLSSFKPNSDYYRHIGTPSPATRFETKIADNKGNII